MKKLAKSLLRITALLAAILLAGCCLITQPVFKPAPKAYPEADPARLREVVEKLAVDYVPRDFLHTENLDGAAAYIKARFAEAGGKVSEQEFAAAGNTYRNVVAEFGPDTEERIVVGAHYDAVGRQPGADDNASGVAGLVELARLLGKSPPPMRVELVAYSLEEPPFFTTPDMGSAVHARSLKERGAKVRLMLSLECIGYFSDGPGSQEYPTVLLEPFYPDKGDFIAVVGRLGEGGAVRRVKKAMLSASPLPVRSINAPRAVPGIDFSDHRSYWDQGYKAVMVTDTAFYRNFAYHTMRDTSDRLDYDRMAMVVKGVYAAVMRAGAGE